MALKAIVLSVLLSVVMYRVYKVVSFMKLRETAYSHEPGPCKFLKLRNDSCSNVHADSQKCEEWAERGECTANRDWMTANCAKSCDYCENPNAPLLGSEDFADLGGGKILISSGLKFKQDPFPERSGHIYLFDFNKPDAGVRRAKMKWDADKVETLNPHGIATWKTKEGKVIVFLINHDSGEFVERFEYNDKENSLLHLDTISHPGFTFLNSIQPTGERSFYVSNMGYFSEGILSELESYLMIKMGNIVHHNGESLTVAASSFLLANGIHFSPDKRHLYLANIGDLSIETFEVLEGNKLKHVHTLDFNTAVDNVKVDAETGDLWLGALAIPWKTLEYMAHPRNPSLVSPSQVLRVKTRDGIPTHDITDIYTNDGSKLNLVTVGVTYRDYMLAGTVYDKTVLCQIVHV